MATFTYVDPGLTTDSELRAWGVAHAPLWAALRARSFAVHVVAIGTGVQAAQRAEHVLKRWMRDGDGRPRRPPPGQPRPTRTSAKKSPGSWKRSPAAIVNSCARPAGSTRRQIVLSGCRDFPRARPPKSIGEPRLTGTRYGARSGWSVPRRHYSDPRHCAPSSGPFRGHDGGHGGGRAEWYTDRGGGVPKTAWGVSHATRCFFAVVVRVFRPSPSLPNRASGEGEDGSDPPFCAADAARLRGGCGTRCTTWCTTLPPAVGGVAPVSRYPCGKAPTPAQARDWTRRRAAPCLTDCCARSLSSSASAP